MANDFAKLQGAWTLSSLEMDGREMPTCGGVEIDGDRFKAVGMGADYVGRVELDATKKPKRFDLTFTEGPETGNRNLGIYALDGDSWKLCLNITGKSRPRSFAAKPGSGNALEIFTRGAAVAAPVTERRMASRAATAPAARSERPRAVTSDAVIELVGEWEMVAAYQGGYALDPSMVKTGRRVTTPTETVTYFGKQVFMKAAYTIDPAKGTIDLLNLIGVKKGKTQLGIYEIDGDTMKICFTGPGQERPADFSSQAGDGRTSAVWKRVRAATSA